MAKLFCVDYDLNKGKDYTKIINELVRIGAKRMLASSWCLHRDDAVTAAALRDHLRNFLDLDDGLWVAQVADWAGFNLLANPNQL